MTARIRQLAPGLLLALGVAIVGVVVHRRVSVVSPHVIAVGFGILGATFGRIDTILVPGLRFAAKKVLRAGIVVLGFRLSSLAVDALGSAGLPYEQLGEDSEADDATTWNIDYIYDIGLMIGGGSTNIQKNIIGERGLDLPREPKVAGRA